MINANVTQSGMTKIIKNLSQYNDKKNVLKYFSRSTRL